MSESFVPVQSKGTVYSNPYGRAIADELKERGAEMAADFVMTLAGGLEGLTDPSAQVHAFVNAVMNGMPQVEAADYFLHMDGEAYAATCEANPEFYLCVKRAEANVALGQYEKVTKHGTPKEALEWLRANRSGTWTPKKTINVAEALTALVKDPKQAEALTREQLDALDSEDEEL